MTALDAFRIEETDRLVNGVFVRERRPLDASLYEVPILMLHGAFEAWWVYGKWLDYFATSGWRCCAMSMRNHAGSRQIPDDDFVNTGIADYVDDVRAVVESLGASPVLVAHSLGGLVAQKVAEERSLEALVLLASVGPAQLGEYGPVQSLDQPVDMSPVIGAEADETTLDRASFEKYVQALEPESPRALNEVRGRTPVDREKITCPILVVGAGAEQYELHTADQIASFYQCDSVVLSKSRHGIMFESEALRAAISVEQWLQSVLPGDQGAPSWRRETRS